MRNEQNGADKIHLASETNNLEDTMAMDNGASNEMTDADFPVMVEDEPKAKFRVGEILELRDKNRKVYRMSDGTEQAVFYPEPVHAFNKDTKTFEDVDNTLVEEEDGKHFISDKNRFVAKFSREEENDELFSIESGMHGVTVLAKKNRKQKNKGMKPRIYKKLTRDLKASDTLVFEDVQDGADYEYSVTGKGVKENIIVKDKADVYRFSFILRQENVTAKFDDVNKRVSFISNEDGKEVFVIPAPFMTDAIGMSSNSIVYELKSAANGDVILNVTADSDWMNEEDRVFPVVIDPQIQLSGETAITTFSYLDGPLYESQTHIIGARSCRDGLEYTSRMYLKFNMPELPRNPRIKKAELTFFQMEGESKCGEYPKLGLYHVNNEIFAGADSFFDIGNLIDFAKMKSGHCEDGNLISYTFDVTTLVDMFNKGETVYSNLVLKMVDESYTYKNQVTLYGALENGDYAPQFAITYESTYGVNTSYRTHTHELGRFGQGSIDLQCGNLIFDCEDFAWAGNRMPVTIRHLYNSSLHAHQYTENNDIKLNTADFSAMKIGNGFKLNIMQSIKPVTFQHEGVMIEGYVHIGENGEETYFKKSNEQVCCDSNSQCYNLYEDITDGDILYDPVKLTLQQGEDAYQFDSMGRLVQIKDEVGNHMDITYTSDRITSVTDGAGREFCFAYNSSGFLSSITAPDETNILYAYTGDLLSAITYQDGEKVTIAYSSDKPESVTLLDSANNNVYKVAYSFVGDRIVDVAEYGVENGNFVIGTESAYSYSVASGRTVVQTTEQADVDEEENIIKTVYTFDDEGNVVSEYVYSEDTGNTGVKGEESGIHPHSGDGGAGVVSNINNLLVGHNFTNLNSWTSMANNDNKITISNHPNESHAKFGKKVLRMQSKNTEHIETGVYQITEVLPIGQYTFSAYLRVLAKFSGDNTPGAFIRVTTEEGVVLAESEHLSIYDTEYTRLITPFELKSEQKVQVQFLMNGKGTVYVDAAQLENNPYANAYNMLENGNFERNTDSWTISSGVSGSSYDCFNMTRSLWMTGDIEKVRNAYQDVTVRTNRGTRETFTLSGWAKAWGLPNHERDGVPTPTFRLRAVIKYKDTYYKEYGTEEFTADFSPCTEEWQFASIEFAKSKYRTIEYIRVFCDYDYNTGGAYFDDIQLIRNSLETNLSASDFVVETVDDGDVDADATETTDTTPTFDEVKDAFGNALTETTFTDGEFGTIYRAFEFTPYNESGNAGNDLVGETDARGNKTIYTVDEDTSRNEEVIDRCGNKTAYEYDASGKTTKVTSKDASDTELANVSYTYDAFDNMTEIVRGDGMKYVLAYNAYHNLESIGVDGNDEKLIHYTYKNGNGRLKEMTYANGDKMKASYNSVGQMIAEKWFDKDDTLTAHYKYVYDGQGNIVRSIDILGAKEYTYEYEEDKLIRATECDIVLSEEVVTSKSVVNAIKYYYDSEGQMTKKVITPAVGSAQTIYFEQTEDDNTVVKFTAGGKTVTSHSKNDSFGRKEFDELQLGTGFVSRQFNYHAGEVTEEHKAKAKLKSSATTQLVSQIVLSGGRSISYEYDAEERITKVTDSAIGTTEYTYDALGQLLTEKLGDTIINSMTYDNYGNILTKNGIEYTYGDGNWKDMLTSVGDQSIAYDAQGNPTSYLGHTLTWEKGRQLKSFDDITYTYNANGIRTSKTVAGIKHTYTLDGTKILREEWDGNTLIPLYDNEDSVCGIIHNNAPYYFHKNLQGDIIAILNKDAEDVATYSYDAWGKVIAVTDKEGVDISADVTHIANINPFRYRGYYYDEEIGLYYVSSRYYDPEIGRFMNSDDAQFPMINELVLSHNLFSYCYNSPIVNSDTTGYIAHNVVGAVVGVFMSLGTYFLGILMGFDTFSWWSLLWAVVGGAASGAFGASVYKRAIQVIFNIIDSVAVNVISCLKKAKVTLEQVVQEVFIGAIVGLISGLVGGNGNGKLFKKASNQYVKKWLSRNKNLIIKGTKYYIKSFAKLLKQKVVKPVFMAFMAGMITNTVLRKKFERLFA